MVSQLFQFYKEKDPRPGESVAKELGTMKGEASAEMLGKLAHGKSDRRLRLAGARALAVRPRSGCAQAAGHTGGATTMLSCPS